MAVRVGLSVQKYKGIETSFILALVRRFGLEYVEITKSVFDELAKIKPLIKRIRAGFHLPIICEDNYDFSCPAYKKEIDELIDLLNIHWKTLNIKYFLAHPPEPAEAKGELHTSVPFLLKNLARLPTHVFIENVQSWNSDEFNQFLKEAKQVLGSQLSGICFDFPHFFVRGEDPIMHLANYNSQIKCVHISDCVRGKDLHLPFGMDGELPIDDVLNALEKHHYKDYINLELLPRSFDDLPFVVYSYLKVLKKFRPWKYYRTKIRTLVVLPFIRRIFSK